MSDVVGMRVGAICSADSQKVELFGYGVYEGDHLPPDDIAGPMGTTIGEIKKMLIEKTGVAFDQWTDGQRANFIKVFSNPRIRLDDGRIVWGNQCWWGPEDKIRQSIGNRAVVMV